MNHPLSRFHRRRNNTRLGEAASGRKASSHLPAKWLDAKPRVIPDAVAAPRTPARALPPPAPPPFAPPKPAEKPRRRWYQYSLRSLLILMLLFSLFMSWFAVKRKRALAQKKAVEAILAADGTVHYDYEFDENGEWVKGATGNGSDWLRKLLGADFFEKVTNVSIGSKKGVEGLAGLSNLKSLEIILDDPFNDSAKPSDTPDVCSTSFPVIDGVDELTIKGLTPGTPMEALGRLRRLKRMTLAYAAHSDNPDAPDLSGLRSCGDLRDLTILDRGGLPDKAIQNIGAMVQLERLVIAVAPNQRVDILQLRDLRRLRELAIGETGLGDPVFQKDDASTVMVLEHAGQLAGFSRLEKLDLFGSDIRSSDLQFLQGLRDLRELDLSNCANIDDSAAVYLKTMKGLKRLNLEGTKISDAVADSIDDAFPDCEVRY